MKRISRQVLGGLVLIGIGGIFLMQQLGYAHFSIGYLISTFWPAILIYLGLQSLLGEGSAKGSFSIGGLIMLGLGVYFLSRNLGWIAMSFGGFVRLALPVLLIGGGLYVILRPRRHQDPPPPPPPSGPQGPYDRGTSHSAETEPPQPIDFSLDEEFERKFGKGAAGGQPEQPFGPEDPHGKGPFTEAPEKGNGGYGRKRGPKHGGHPYDNGYDEWHEDDDDGSLNGSGYANDGKRNSNISTFIGDVHLGREPFSLKNTNISMFIGDTVLDLTNAQIPYGVTKITVSAFIGDLKVYIPEDMDIGISVTSSSFIGDLEVLDQSKDGIMNSLTLKTPYYKDARKKIRINVSAFIGDIKVKTVG